MDLKSNPPHFLHLAHASGWFQQRVVSHPTFSCQVKHGAEKLPYYTVDLHMEYAMACRKRSRKERDEEARIVWWVLAQAQAAYHTDCADLSCR